MGQGTQTEQNKGNQTGVTPEQGTPGTGPGQLGQEPQHQSEKGLQPIPDRKEGNEKEGFIPLSSKAQLKGIAEKYYRGQTRPEKVFSKLLSV